MDEPVLGAHVCYPAGFWIGTPDGDLGVHVPAGRGPAAELDRALVAALGR